MCPQRNIEHRFDLAGMKAGDWFMACPECLEQFPVNTAGPNHCQCGSWKRLYNVTAQDVRLLLPKTE